MIPSPVYCHCCFLFFHVLFDFFELLVFKLLRLYTGTWRSVRSLYSVSWHKVLFSSIFFLKVSVKKCDNVITGLWFLRSNHRLSQGLRVSLASLEARAFFHLNKDTVLDE